MVPILGIVIVPGRTSIVRDRNHGPPFSLPLDPPLGSTDATGMDASTRIGAWTTGITTFLVIAAIAWWATRSTSLASDHADPAIGRNWTTLQTRWGAPACSAASARLQSRESAARRPKGESGLVIPHAELLLVGATPAIGPGSVASNRVIVFTSDETVRAFARRIATGKLDAAGGETRVAIDRAAPVHVVEIDARGHVQSIRDIRPVFVTHLPR
jgi:hypothetical protein